MVTYFNLKVGYNNAIIIYKLFCNYIGVYMCVPSQYRNQ